MRLAAVTDADFLLDFLSFLQQPSSGEVFNDGGAGLVNVESSVFAACFADLAVLGQEPDNGEFVFYDGFDVFFVAVSANHDDARAKRGVHAFVGDNGHGAVDEGHDDCFADVFAVPRVLGFTSTATQAGMNSGREVAIMSVFVGAFQLETNVMQGAFAFDVVHFRVGYGGFVVGTPVHGVRALIHETFLVQQNEAQLRASPVIWVHRAVLGGPVDAAAQLQDAFLHHGNVLLDELHAHLAELVRRQITLADVICFFDLDFDA